MPRKDYRDVTQRKPKTKGKGDELIDWTIEDLRKRWKLRTGQLDIIKEQLLHGMDREPENITTPKRKGITPIPSQEERWKQEEEDVQKALGQDAEGNTISEVGRNWQNPEMGPEQPEITFDEEDDTAVLNDGDQANVENKIVVKKKIDKIIAEEKNAQYLKSVSWDGMNRTYTSDYREAVKNAAGWSAYYDEPDEAGNPIARSDVFTRGEDGQPLGVMGRSQRRAYDMKMHEAKMATKAQMEDSGRSESDVKAINSKEGLEPVITGGESAKTDVSKGSEANIIKPPEREEIKLPGGS
jgi:hypothetical protein